MNPTNDINTLEDKFQNIYVELTDGTVGMFSGPALFEGQPSDNIKTISFSKPHQLFNNQTWSDLWIQDEDQSSRRKGAGNFNDISEVERQTQDAFSSEASEDKASGNLTSVI